MKGNLLTRTSRIGLTRNQDAGFLSGHLLLAILFFAVSFARPAHADVLCEVAVPSSCATSKDESAARQPRVVNRIDASSESECFERARATTAACNHLLGGKAEITARFLNGPVETIRQITESGPSPAHGDTVVRTPIVYSESFRAEIEQLGYSPRFAPGVVNFNNDRLIRIRHRNYLQFQTRDGQWRFSDLAALATDAIRRLPDVTAFTWVWDNRSLASDQRIYYDSRGSAYTLIQSGRTQLKDGKGVSYRSYVLVSRDDGASWTAVALPIPDERPTWRARIEHNDGNNDRGGPPPILLYDREENRKTRSTRLYMYVLAWRGDSLTVPSPVLLSEKSLLIENHSGAANSLASTAERIYITYPGSKALSDARGTPAYFIVFDKKKAAVESETLVGFGGAAANVDDHNVPGICIGTRQTIHVLLLGHQEALQFRSGKVDGTNVTWTQVEKIGQSPTPAGGYTYGSLNCDRAGNAYITTRWAGDRYRFQLVFLHRKPDGSWANWAGVRHRVLVDPARTFYGVWRQKLTLSADGGIYLWYSYYANQLSKEEFPKLKWRFPFHDWTQVKEMQPRFCVKADDPRCFLHPMPEVTSVDLRSNDAGGNWYFLQ